VKTLRELRQQIASKPTVETLPALIVFKRVAVRVYPNAKSIALYYSDQLKQFVVYPSNF
jgi:hypothetical protein